MCQQCFEQKYYGFQSYWEFHVFCTKLHQLLEAGTLEEGRPPKPPDHYGWEVWFLCNSCDECWALSSPDNAWRGYFLPVHEAQAYTQRLRRSDLRRKLLVVGILVVTGLFLLSKWLG